MKRKKFVLCSILIISHMLMIRETIARNIGGNLKPEIYERNKGFDDSRRLQEPVAVQDQYIQDPMNADFLDALSSSYQTNPAMQGSDVDQRLAAESVAEAKAGYHPSIEGSLSNTRSLAKNNPASAPGGGAGTDGYKTYNTTQTAGVTLRQNLFKGGQTMFTVSAAEEGLKGSWETFKNTEQSVLLAAAQAYLDLILKRRTLTQRQSSEKFLKDNYEYVKALQEAGENKTISDVAEAESKYFSAVSARVKAEGDLDIAVAVYINVVGKNPNEYLENPTVPLEIIPKNVDELQTLALESNPEIKGLEYGVKQARENVKVARTAWAPSLDVSLNAGRNLSYTQDDRPRNASPNDTRATNYAAATTLTVPFYQKGSEYSGLRKQKENESKARVTLENKRREVRQNCRRYWDQLISSRNQTDSLRVAIKSAQINLDGKRKAYEVGEGILLEILQAEEQLTTARINLIQAEKDYREAVFQLMKLVGKLATDTFRLNVPKYDYEKYYNKVKAGIF